jgi:20S proteasome subunit alpha 5
MSLDPSGTMIKYHAKGMGSAQEAIESILQEQYKKVQSAPSASFCQEMHLEDAEKLAISILKQVIEDKVHYLNRLIHNIQ